MPPSPCSCADARPDATASTAAELNQQIRQLVVRTAVWTADARAELGRLQAEWARADAAERQAA